MIPDVDMTHYEDLGCLHDMFRKQAFETPDNVAVVTSIGQKVTFKELDFMSEVLATKLRTLTVSRNKVVGILMEKSLEFVISYIAILKAGGAYLTLEVSFPVTFLDTIIDDSTPTVILTKSSFQDRITRAVPTLILDDGWVQKYGEQNKKYGLLPPLEPVSLDDMAYTEYSSGTTGQPKGIQCPHRGAVFSYTWRHLAYKYQENEREACNIFFVWEMLRPILKGVPMYIIDDTVIYDPVKLVHFLRDNQITRVLFTPSLLQAILDTTAIISLRDSLKTMKYIILCGEVVTTALRNRFVSLLPTVKLLNLYSISECHDVAYSDLSADLVLNDRTYCPVGKILPKVCVLIMDENGNKCDTGCSGEVYVGGPTLAIGYLNRPKLNEERFIKTNDELKEFVGPRLYKTGDWGYVLSDGNLEIVGRCDTVVKIRGYTIELQAVESALMNIPEINMACVLAVGDEGTDKILTAYVVLDTNCKEKSNYFRTILKHKLPFYMIPSQFFYLDQIPLHETTGKINKQSLPHPNVGNIDELIEDDDSLSIIGKEIKKLWYNMLKINSIDSEDNFFDLGGHSLLAAAIINKLNEKFGTNLSVFDLYMNPTVGSLTKKLETGIDTILDSLDLSIEVNKYATTQSVPPIKLHSFWKSIHFSENLFTSGNVLLTGSTGYLGSYILRELLLSTQLTIYCLGRTKYGQNLENRIKSIISNFNISVNASRVVPVEGDITLINFGLQEAEYLALCYDIRYVIHCAAFVNLILPYNVLCRTNVIGTQNVISFCLSKQLKPLHFISTSDVFSRNQGICSEKSDMYEHITQLHGMGGYCETKWTAEQLVLRASQIGLPTLISRCGNISAPTGSVGWSWNKNDLNLFLIRGVLFSGTAPDIPWMIELTPVDFASKMIVKLTTNITKHYGKIFHIINTNTMECRELWTLMNEIGYNIEIVPYDIWINNVRKTCLQENSLRQMLLLLDSILRTSNYLINTNCYERENTNKFLESNNFVYPAVNTSLFKIYLKRLVENNYIHSIAEKSIKAESPGLLENKVALVVGASSGIGYAIAKELAKNGFIVVAASRRLHKLELLQKELNGEKHIVPLKLDITDPNEVNYVVPYIKNTIGPIDIFVNSAGVMYYCETKNVELEDWKQMVRTNCEGALNCIAAILPDMVQRNTGHIINITSDAGRKAFAGLAVYSGTKFFLEGFSSALRQEVSKFNIKVTSIQPGDVETGLHQKSTDLEAIKQYSYNIPYLKAKDIANAVLYAVKQPINCAVNEILIEPILGPI